MSLQTITCAARLDYTLQQGSTFIRVPVFEGVDLTTASFRGQVRRTHCSSTVLATLAVTAASATELRIELTPLQTTALPVAELVYDIEAYTADDAWVQRILEGTLTVTPEVTRG